MVKHASHHFPNFNQAQTQIFLKFMSITMMYSNSLHFRSTFVPSKLHLKKKTCITLHSKPRNKCRQAFNTLTRNADFFWDGTWIYDNNI